jgi:hypothetical protein
MIMLIFMVLGTSLLVRWSYDANRSRIEGKSLQAFYIARSGADALGTYIETNPDNLSNADLKMRVYTLAPTSGNTSTSNPVSLGNGSYTLQVNRPSDNPSLIKIISTSTVDNFHQSVTLALQETQIPHLNPDGTIYSTYSWSYKKWEFKPLTP